MPTLFQINVVANSGSTGRITEGISEVILKNGWTSYIAYGRWANSSNAQLYKIENKCGVYVHALISRIFDMHGLASSRATKRLIEEIKIVKPDLIHLHNIHGYYLNYQLLFQFLSEVDIPIVWTLHDCWPYTGHCVHYTNVNCKKWVEGCFACPNLLDYPTAIMCDNSKFNFSKKKQAFTSIKKMVIVTVSQWLANEVKQSFLGKYPVGIVQNGIDINVFYPVESTTRIKYNIKNKFIILGVASVWNNRKRLSDFVKLAERISKNDIIILVGLNKKQISQLPSNIIGIEKTENVKELVELYSSADLYVSFSAEETFGLTTIESMACGTPVLVCRSTACPEIVTDDTGFVIEPYDIDGALNVVLTVKKMGKQFFSDKCRSYILNNFRNEDKYENYFTIYKKFL